MNSYIIPLGALAAAGYMFMNRTPPLVDGTPSLTFYYMTSCPHCKNMYPEMRRLGWSYNGVVVRWVEAAANEAREMGINSFPTLIHCGADGRQSKYTGARNSEAIKTWLNTLT
jgi:hypothetical protein